MEETKEPRNDQRGNNKMGGGGRGGGGGGGIGAVVLLGGVLATAAFASVFALGQKRRSYDKDRRHKSEKDEANKGQEIVPNDEKLYEHEHIRKEETEKNSTVKISVDEETKVSERVGEVDDGFVIVKEEIPLMAEEEKVESMKEETNLEQVSTEDKTAEREESDGGIDSKEGENSEVCHDADVNGVEGEENVNMEEKKCVEAEASGRAMVDLIADEIVFSEKTTLLQTDSVTVKSRVEEKTATKHVEEDKTSTQQNVEEEQISPEEVEVVKYVAVEAALQNLETEEEMIVHQEVSRKDGDEGSNEVIETKTLVHTSAETNRMKVALCSEEHSKWEDQWQGEWPKVSSKETKQAKGMSYEVGGKIQEDYSASFTNKDEVMRQEHPSNSTRVMIWTLSVLSSLSCSWYLDLSPAKLCLVVFLTVFLLEIYGYPLLNRKPAQCLHPAEGERVYGQGSLKK